MIAVEVDCDGCGEVVDRVTGGNYAFRYILKNGEVKIRRPRMFICNRCFNTNRIRKGDQPADGYVLKEDSHAYLHSNMDEGELLLLGPAPNDES